MGSHQLNRKQLMMLIFLIIATAFTFGRTYQNEFLGIDDHVYVWDNPHIRDGLTLEGITWAFQAGLTDLKGFADYWQPMTFLSRMTDISLFKFRSGMHHLVNLFFHLLNVVLLYLFIWRISKQSRLSFFVAALFALHPLQSEILGWVTARKDVLSLFFGLITMHVYVGTKNQQGGATGRSPLLLAFCFALSLMAKPMMVTLPILLLLIDAWQMDINNISWTWKQWQSHFLNKWPLFLMIALYLPIPFLGQPQAFDFELNNPIVRGITAYSFYIGKLLLPVNLSLYGPVPETVLPLRNILSSIALMCTLSGILYWFSRRKMIILLGWLWFCIACLPIISLPIADRFMYLPMIGFWLAALSLLEITLHNKKVLTLILACILMIFMVSSFKQIAVWKNNETVLKHALEYSNENYAAHNVLGTVYGEEGYFSLAMKHLEEAIRIKPSRDKPYNNMGMILEKQGRLDEALEYYEKSLALKPNDFRSVSNIGIMHIRQGNTKKGIEYLERAVDLSPKMKGVQNNLAIAYFKGGNIKKAEQLAHQFKSPYVFNQFGIFMVADSDYASARHYFNDALQIDPSYQEAKNNLRHLDDVLRK